jgi:hypothetical protein
MATIDTSGRPAYMYDEDTDTWYAISGRVSTSANYVWTGAQNYTNNVIIDGELRATLKFNTFLNPAARSAAITSPSVGLLTFLQQDAGGSTINRFEYWSGSAWTPIADPNAATLNGVQTLTNKTLTSPVINTGDINTPDIDGGTIDNASITGGTVDQATITQFKTALSFNQKTASYTLVLTDRDKVVEISNAGATTLTVPLNSSVAFPVGSSITILQTGAGQITVAGASGVTVNATPGLKLRTQWSVATLIKRATDTWVLMGDLSA